MGLADLHMHTVYSYDGTASVPAVLARTKQVGLDVIAITDHDEIRGALKAVELAPRFDIEIIPGIEITTARRGSKTSQRQNMIVLILMILSLIVVFAIDTRQKRRRYPTDGK
ncbi:MAG TPA: PHP domain-containing protein [Anaerolineales bacterium]